MKKVTIILAVLTSLTLAGCKDEPSSGDLKDSLKLLAEPCKDVISISGVEKVNGREGREPNTYIISAKYEVKYAPLKEFSKRLEDAQEAAKSFNAEINDDYVKQLGEKIEAAKIKVSELQQVYKNKNDEMSDCANLECRYKKVEEGDVIAREIHDVQVQSDNWRNERQAMKRVKIPDVGDINPVVRSELRNRCITTQTFANFIPLHRVENYFEELSMDMSGEITMIKTEKGWRMAAIGL